MDKRLSVFLLFLFFFLVELELYFCNSKPNLAGCELLCLWAQDNDQEKIVDYTYPNRGDTGIALNSTATLAGDTGVSGTPSLSPSASIHPSPSPSI